MSELKPCAHCGGDAKEYFETVSPGGQHHNGPLAYWVFCELCGISTAHVNSRSQQRHRIMWNTRAFDERAFLAVLYASREKALDNMEGTNAEEFEHWTAIHNAYCTIIEAIEKEHK